MAALKAAQMARKMRAWKWPLDRASGEVLGTFMRVVSVVGRGANGCSGWNSEWGGDGGLETVRGEKAFTKFALKEGEKAVAVGGC